MKVNFSRLVLSALLTSPVSALADNILPSPSGDVRIVGEYLEEKSVSVGGELFPLGDFRADLLEKVGNLVLVGIYSGGTACPASFAWLDTTPDNLSLTESFGTCSDLYKLSFNSETVTLTMPSFNASEGQVAFVFDGKAVRRQLLGLKSSKTARLSEGSVDVWIGESPYEYLTAQEHEAALIELLGWDNLDELRNTLVIGSQEMIVEDSWIVGQGCMPHMCDTNYAAIALHRASGHLIAAIKRDGSRPRLLGTPSDALPDTIRSIMVSN